MKITGFRHVGLSVSDLDSSAEWYMRVLGCEQLFKESAPERSAVILRMPGTNILLGLVHHRTNTADAFNPTRTGLDHLCFAVQSREDLEAGTIHLDEHKVERSEIVEMATSPILNFKDPDGIALSLAIPPAMTP